MSIIWDENVFLISIHAPREGGDCMESSTEMLKKISIHAPREGGDKEGSGTSSRWVAFQSTPPARGATAGRTSHTTNNNQFQSTPPARGATSVW